MKEDYEKILRKLPERISVALKKCSLFFNGAEEIRLRENCSLALTIGASTFFINEDGGASCFSSENCLKISKEEIDNSYYMLCENSVFSHDSEAKRGFITLEGGHRVGIGGTFLDNGDVTDITSLNIRIAKDINNASIDIAEEVLLSGLLVAGPPGSGKTTFLKDAVRRLSCGKNSKRVTVIDSRNELCRIDGKSGENCDILRIADKAKGIEMAIRTLYPQVVIFDEIGNLDQARSVRECFNCGVCVMTSVHAGNIEDLRSRKTVKELIISGAIKNIVLLSVGHKEKPLLISAKEV